MAAGKAVSREEKRGETAVWRVPLLVLAVTFIRSERSFPIRFAKILFVCGFFGFGKQAGRPCPFLRCIRELRCDRHPNGFRVPAMFGFGRTSLGQVHWAS